MNSRVAPHVDPSIGNDRALPVRTRLEPYDVEGVIAFTAFAIVYRACDPATEQVVAIKEYLPEGLATRNSKGRVSPRTLRDAERLELGRRAFVEEAQTLARFEHPSLLRVLGLLQANGTAYRVMRYTPGPTLLAHRIALGASPAIQDFRLWLDGLLGALSALHDKGCTHGSVAPGNILLRPGERPLLLDFGAVPRALVFDRRVTAPASDLYSLAATLYYGISGEWPAAPLECSAPRETQSHHLSLADAWRRARGSWPMPPDLERVFAAIDACLAAPPPQRPQSVAEFREWLSRGGAVPSSSLPPGTGPAPEAGRSEAMTAGIAEGVDGDADTDADVDADGDADAEALQLSDATQDVEEGPAAGGIGTSVPELPMVSSPTGLEMPARVDAASFPDQAVAAPAGPVALRGAWSRHVVWTAALALTLSVGLGFWSSRRGADAAPPPPAPALAIAPPMEAVQAPAVPSAPLLVIVEPPAAGLPEPGQSTVVPVEPKADLPVPAARSTPKLAAAPPPVGSPRQACGERTGFALYQCMQQQCTKASWSKHAQCVQMRRSDGLN